MVSFVKKTGNYREMLGFLGLPDSFAGVTDDAKQTIAKDLPRTPFVDFNGKTINSLRQTWNSDDISPSYSQGNIFGGPFEAAWGLYVCASPLFLRANPPRNDDDRNLYIQNDKKCLLSFAYYNNEGTPCGFSFVCSSYDPSLWLAIVTHDTTASPEKRKVTVYGSQEIFFKQDAILPGGEIQANLIDSLKSDTIGELLADLIQHDGMVNLEVINQLMPRILANQNIDNRDFKRGILQELIEHTQAPEYGDLQRTLQQIKHESDQDFNYFAGATFDNKMDEMISVYKAPYVNDGRELDAFGLTLYAIDYNLQAQKQRALRDDRGTLAKDLDEKAAKLRLCRDDPNRVVADYITTLTTQPTPTVVNAVTAHQEPQDTIETSDFQRLCQETQLLVDELKGNWPERCQVVTDANALIKAISRRPEASLSKENKDKFKKTLERISNFIECIKQPLININKLKYHEFIEDTYAADQSWMNEIHSFARSVAVVAYQQESSFFEKKLQLFIPLDYQFATDEEKLVSEATYRAGCQFLNDIQVASGQRLDGSLLMEAGRALNQGFSMLDEPYKTQTTRHLFKFSESIKSEPVKIALQNFANTVWQAQVGALKQQLNALTDPDLKENGLALLEHANTMQYQQSPDGFYGFQDAVDLASTILREPDNVKNINRLSLISKEFSYHVAKMLCHQQQELFQERLNDLLDKQAEDTTGVFNKAVEAGDKFLKGIRCISGESLDAALLARLNHALYYGLSMLNERDMGQTYHQFIAFSKRVKNASLRKLSEDFSNEVFKAVWQAQIESFKNKLEHLTESDLKTTGYRLLTCIKNIAGENPQALSHRDFTDLHQGLHYASATLTQPDNAQNIDGLATLSKIVSGKSSSHWKTFGAVLLAFAGAALVVAGVLGALPSQGASLALVVVGTAALAASAGLAKAAVVDSNKRLAKSLSLFKSAIQKERDERNNDQPTNSP